jgi:hypothetical protein
MARLYRDHQQAAVDKIPPTSVANGTKRLNSAVAPMPDTLGLSQTRKPSSFLQLQRLVGNKEVGRFLRQSGQLPPSRRPTAQPRTEVRAKPTAQIQRLVGFEAEFSVPSMPASPGALHVMTGAHAHEGNLPTPAIEGFLGGGLPYGANASLGAANADFQLKADHNALQTRHSAIRVKLVNMGYPMPPLADTMSNLEYVTPAEDELAAHSTALFNQHLNAVANHANTVIGSQVGLNAIPAPAATARTGLPEQDFRTWLGPRYSEISAEIDAFKEATKNEFYLQATVGVIPSALPDLYKSDRSHWLNPLPSIFQSIANATHAMVESVVNDNVFSNHAYVIDLKTDAVNYQAFVGLLYTIASYMIGQAVNKTSLFDGSSDKNAVPYLSKMANLQLIRTQAMPTELRTQPLPTVVLNRINAVFSGSRYCQSRYWIDAFELVARPTRGDVIPNNLIYRMFLGYDINAVASPRNFDNPDPMPNAVRQNSNDQQGAQIEYRYITERPDTNGLNAALMKIVNQVRMLNTKHLSTTDRQQMLDGADQ